jgi:hypothetical protein
MVLTILLRMRMTKQQMEVMRYMKTEKGRDAETILYGFPLALP